MIEIATFLAVTILNEGFMPIVKVMDVMRATIGQQTEMHANSRNEARITRSQQRLTNFARNERINRREERVAPQDLYEQEEGSPYGAGLAN